MPAQDDAPVADVLLLERDEGLREPFRVWLDDRWDVVTATNVDEALETFSPTVPAVVTSDRLLRCSVEEFLTELADRGYSNAVVILGTREVEPTVDGVTVFHLLKPVDRAELVAAVADALS